MDDLKLQNAHKGYVEVCSQNGLGLGYVHTEKFVERTDFEKDEIYEVERWVPYIDLPEKASGFLQVGRLTGYSTRKEAIEALKRAWEGRSPERSNHLDIWLKYSIMEDICEEKEEK